MLEASPQAEPERPQPPRYQPLTIVLAAVCTGIVADRVLGLPVAVWWTVAGVAWAFWIGLWRFRRDRASGMVLLVAAAACAAGWHHVRWNLFADTDLGCYVRRATQPVCVEAVAIRRPRRLPAPEFSPMQAVPVGERTQVEVELTSIRDGATWQDASGRARLTVDGHLLGVHAGDRLRIFGQLSATRAAENPGEFDFAAHERADRRLCYLRSGFPECVTLVERGRWASPTRWIDNLRAAGNRLLRAHLDQRRAELAAAVLLGAREEIGQERSKAFVETGTAHLLAISGLHVGIVAGALFLGLRLALMPWKWAVAVVAIATVLYTLLTDARPPAIRAAILVLVLCGSMYLGRPRSAFNSLAAAALVVLALNPADLFRTGVRLSFVAVAGLMWFAPRWFGVLGRQTGLKRLLAASRGWPLRIFWTFSRSLRHLTLVSALIWLLTIPLVTARFHVFAPAALVLNTLLWVPMATALVCGFGVLLFGWLLPPLGAVFGWGCNGSLGLLEWCIETARDVPCSHFWVPGPADWWLAGYYGGLGLWAAFPALRPRWRRGSGPLAVALLTGWVAVGLVASAARSHGGRLDCTFLSVGHGSAVVVRLPSGQTMLYDAGRFGSPRMGAQSIASCLWSYGVSRLDAVVLTHSDIDHFNALPDLLERFSVGTVYVSPQMFEEDTPALGALEKAIRQRGIPIRKVAAGDKFGGGGECRVEVLHPPRGALSGPDNVNSVVLTIEHLGRRILLTGDLEPPGLDGVLAAPPLDCDLLLAPHHGSPLSDPPGLATWCTPEWVVISGSLSSYQPETAAAYRASGARVLHTGNVGAVRVTVDATGIEVTSFLESH